MAGVSGSEQHRGVLKPHPARNVMSRHRPPQVLAYMTPFPCSIRIEAPLGEAQAFLRRHPAPAPDEVA
jgi:hypothetical protein